MSVVPQLTFPCRLPPDPRGFPHGKDYPRVLRATYDNNKGTGWNIPSLKTGRTLDAMSTIERHLFVRSQVDPLVLDSRDQYPMHSLAKLAPYLKDPTRRIPRSLVPTLDMVLTIQDAGARDGYRFEAVSVKPYSELGDRDVQSRMAREQEFCDSLDWRWTLFTERETDPARYKSGHLLCCMAAHSDLDSLRGVAEANANYVADRSNDKPLRQVKRALAKRLNTDTARASEIIAAMALFGFVKLDFDAELSDGDPLCLLKP
jgi:hypothetical protein